MHDSPTAESRPSWRSTRQRNAVLRALGDRPDFTSARELHAALAAEGPTAGLTTVYRTLQTLEQRGFVDVVRDRSGERLYRLRPTDGHRHYLVCRRCGLSLPLESDAVERWTEAVAAATGFAELEHTVELTGLCEDCRSTTDRPAPRP